MRQDFRPSGIVIGVPDAYETPGGLARTRGRRRAAVETAAVPNFEAVDAAFIDALLGQDMDLVDEFEYEADPGRIRSTRARSVDEQTLSVSMMAEPGETAIALIEQDGVYSWQFPVDDSQGTGRRARRGSDPRELRFEIPLSDSARGAGTRSVFGSARDLVGRVRGRVLKTATDAVLGLLEGKVDRGLVVMRDGGPEEWTRLDDPAALGLPAEGEARVLLFVHGTFSSTVGSFHALGSLEDGAQLLQDMWGRYDAVIGFDHPTLSVDPEENAVELFRLLEGASHGPVVLDAVSYSRGGLVLRSLVESLLPRSGLDVRLERAIFVGATNAGTALAEPDNWRDFIDVYTNLVLGATRAVALVPGAAPVATVVGGAVKGLGAAVKFLVNHTIDAVAVPGLAAMEPDGDFVRRLNQIQPGQPEPEDVRYYAVTSNFEGGAASGGLANELPRKFLMRAADPLVDRLMANKPNDLVVDTPSMTAIDVAGGHRVREILDFGENSVVYHTVYFTQVALGKRLRTWLELGNGSSRRFRVVPGQDERLAQVEPELVSGSDVLPPEPARAAPQAVAKRPVLRFEVVWDDIAKATGDVYAVGHYFGVAPQRAERALDMVVSDSTREEDLVLTRLTRSNVLRGDLGDISFFPWGGRNRRNRLIAVCGMGGPGTFGSSGLRQLQHNLAQFLVAFPNPRTLCTVLIGAGEGSMAVDEAARQLVLGFGDAIRATGRREDWIRRVRIVELTKTKADEIHAALTELQEAGGFPVEVDLAGPVTVGGYGMVTDEAARTLLVRAASLAVHSGSARKTFEDLEGHLPEEIRAAVWLRVDEEAGAEPEESPLRHQLREAWEDAEGDITELTQTLPRPAAAPTEPQRITFVRADDAYLVSAITDNATVPERVNPVQHTLVKQAVEQMTDPLPGEMADLSDLLFYLTLPRDFRALMAPDAPLIFEVDRHTASIHWEMLASGTGDSSYRPIGLTRPVARQLRTQYSETVAIGRGAPLPEINVLVIGDPGDPDRGHNLPHAREEARQVAAYLQSLADDDRLSINVRQLIGAPNYPERGVPPATRLEVIRTLAKGDIDVVHYAGHGDFDQEDPRKSGWLFHDGLLTAGEIQRIDMLPSLIVANACLTGRVSTMSAAGQTGSGPRGEVGLLPSLADEFFNRGARNYIGTAWEIDDAGAVVFAKAFYEAFFTEKKGGRPRSIGQALLEARKTLHRWELSQRDDLVLWAAYQHYGDPGFFRSDM